MRNKVGFGIVLALSYVCLMSHASWGSSYSESPLRETYSIYDEIRSSPVIGSDGWIRVASSAPSSKDKPVNSLMYEWDSLLVNLADAGGKRYLKVTMKLELTDAHLHEEISERSYEVKDALITLLSSKEYEDISTPSGKTRLKQEIMNRVNKIVKNGQVKEVYFTDFIVQ